MIALLASVISSGCATPVSYRAHPLFDERLRAGLKVALLPPDVKVFQLTATDTEEPMAEWSETARRSLQTAIGKYLRGNPRLTMREFDPMNSEASREKFEDALSLFQIVALSTAYHTYPGGIPLKTKMDRFEYSLGPLPALGGGSEADALLIVQGVDYVSTTGRIALRALAMLLMAGAGGAGPRGTAPVGAYGLGSSGESVLSASLVDSQTGDILWFNRRALGEGHDLRSPTSVEALVADVFEVLAAVPARKPRKEQKP